MDDGKSLSIARSFTGFGHESNAVHHATRRDVPFSPLFFSGNVTKITSSQKLLPLN